MKISVKTLKGSSFEIEVQPEDTIADVKRNIETSQGISLYPAEEQTLIHQGKILKDDTTLAANNVVENSFLVIMKSNKAKAGTSSNKTAPANQAPPTNTVPPVPATPALQPAASSLTLVPNSAPPPTATGAPPPAVTASTEDVYGQAASNLVAGGTLEQTIQQLLDMGGGTWDRDMVTRALRAAFNNPERAVEYLYSGIPENIGEPAVPRAPVTGVAGANSPVGVQLPVQPPVPSTGPNANPLDLFPQGLPNVGSNTGGSGNLDFLRNSPQFRALQAIVQSNPQVLQPMLQELAKQNPQILSLIQEHQGEFLRLMNEPAEGAEGGNLAEELADAVPQAITVTPEERQAIERLEAMGFDRALVLEVFFACNKNEELAANYLLDHIHEFEE